MLTKLVEAVFAPKYPKHYRGRHRVSPRQLPDDESRLPSAELAS